MNEVARARSRRRAWMLVLAVALALAAGLVALVVLIDPESRAGLPVRFAAARDSVAAFARALEALGERIADVDFVALGIGLLFSMANIALRSFAWRNILRAAYPATPLRWLSVFGATYAGIGVNAIVPARLGDAVKLMLVHRRIEKATYPTLASTFIAEGVLDAIVGGTIILVAWQSGVLPGMPQLTSLPLFEIGWYARHPWILAVLVVALALSVLLVESRVQRFWDRVRQGVAILATPGRYVGQVAIYQLLGWGCRIGGAYLFLDAFHVDATLRNALLVQAASSLSTLVPATPGGLGPRQALLIVLLAGAASPGTVLAFGVGVELTLAAWNVLIGFTFLTVMMRGTGVSTVLRSARATRDARPDLT